METTSKPGGFGAALRALRGAAGMTLDEVADEAGVSKSYLSRVENDLLTPTPGWVAIVTIAIGDHIAKKPQAVSA